MDEDEGDSVELREGAHCRYEGGRFPWGHAVVVETTSDGVVVELDHVGEVLVPVADVTVAEEPDLDDD